MTVTGDGWSYRSTDRSGRKTDVHFDSQTDKLSGAGDKVTVKYVPTGNPLLTDWRLCEEDTGKELWRVVRAVSLKGDAFVNYNSGITADGKQWFDVSYFRKER